MVVTHGPLRSFASAEEYFDLISGMSDEVRSKFDQPRTPCHFLLNWVPTIPNLITENPNEKL